MSALTRRDIIGDGVSVITKLKWETVTTLPTGIEYDNGTPVYNSTDNKVYFKINGVWTPIPFDNTGNISWGGTYDLDTNTTMPTPANGNQAEQWIATGTTPKVLDGVTVEAGDSIFYDPTTTSHSVTQANLVKAESSDVGTNEDTKYMTAKTVEEAIDAKALSAGDGIDNAIFDTGVVKVQPYSEGFTESVPEFPAGTIFNQKYSSKNVGGVYTKIGEGYFYIDKSIGTPYTVSFNNSNLTSKYRGNLYYNSVVDFTLAPVIQIDSAGQFRSNGWALIQGNYTTDSVVASDPVSTSFSGILFANGLQSILLSTVNSTFGSLDTFEDVKGIYPDSIVPINYIQSGTPAQTWISGTYSVSQNYVPTIERVSVTVDGVDVIVNDDINNIAIGSVADGKAMKDYVDSITTDQVTTANLTLVANVAQSFTLTSATQYPDVSILEEVSPNIYKGNVEDNYDIDIDFTTPTPTVTITSNTDVTIRVIVKGY